MGVSEAKQILVDAIENAPRMQGEHPASWLTCRIRLALAALDTPEAWNFGEPPSDIGTWVWLCWSTSDGRLLVSPGWNVNGHWESHHYGRIHAAIVAWKQYRIPPPPTAVEIDASREKQT